MVLSMDMIIKHVVHEKNLMIHLDFCKQNCFSHSNIEIYFSYSLFQTLTSIGDIATHLGFTNFPQQDHCSALIKV